MDVHQTAPAEPRRSQSCAIHCGYLSATGPRAGGHVSCRRTPHEASPPPSRRVFTLPQATLNGFAAVSADCLAFARRSKELEAEQRTQMLPQHQARAGGTVAFLALRAVFAAVSLAVFLEKRIESYQATAWVSVKRSI